MTSSPNERSISQKFDDVHKLFNIILDSESNLPSTQERMVKCIRSLEELTQDINQLQVFSSNETLDDLQTGYFKFIQLPFFLGSLWQLRMTGDRKELCRISSIYFKDFLKKLYEYEIVTNVHPIYREKLLDNGAGGDTSGGSVVNKISTKMTPDQKRASTIAKFKEKKELDGQIQELEKRRQENDDDDEGRELWLTKLKRMHIDAVSDLENIATELELIRMMEEKNEKGEVELPPPPKSTGNLPYKTFIITRNDLQKQVYGAGYPSLAVMTVDEFYTQREAEGGWDHLKNSKPNQNPNQGEDEEDKNKDEDEEIDNPEKLAQVRDFDEYKDDHRTGWGNRYNRS